MNQLLTESFPVLIDLINETYTDRVEQILSAGIDENGTVTCVAQDGAKKLSIQIADTGIKIGLYNPKPTGQFSVPEPNRPTQIAAKMFKVLITAINPSAEPRPHGGTCDLISDELAVGGDRPINVTITIQSALPYKRGKTTYTGADKALISNWLPDQCGMRGKSVGEDAKPTDLAAALTRATWLEWEIISGKEILDIPAPPSRPGAKY
jgi:hypothetical protein